MRPFARIVVVIPTLNEEVHIERSVRSARRLGDVLVVDSGSTDRTQEIAVRLGAKVIQHAWAGYAAQKNWAIGRLADSAEWVFFLDADEWITGDLAREIQGKLDSRSAGFHVPRQNVFEGRVLRHAGWYPDYQLRLFRPTVGRFEERLVHEHVLVDGPVSFLSRPLMHENRKGVDAFIARHARYADLEATEIAKARRGLVGRQRQGRLFGTWPERRRYLKTKVWYRLPFRPAARFAWMYVVKRGFLDGRQGLVYCQLLAAYEAMIDARLLELDRRRRPGVNAAASVTPRVEPVRVCPSCHDQLVPSTTMRRCTHCGESYEIVNEMPILVGDLSNSIHDEIDHQGGPPIQD